MNSSVYRQLLEVMRDGTLDPELALLNASLVPHVFPVLAAADKSLISKSRESLTTRTVHSELVYNYSGSKHISKSLKRCGIENDSSYILVACFRATEDESAIQGKEIDLEQLEVQADQAHILKHYKIPVAEHEISSLADAVTSRIASRDAL